MSIDGLSAEMLNLMARSVENHESHKRIHGGHCHWTYRHGNYVSPWFWPTREDAEHASRSLIPDPRVPEDPEVYQVHGAHCACTPVTEGFPT